MFFIIKNLNKKINIYYERDIINIIDIIYIINVLTFYVSLVLS